MRPAASWAVALFVVAAGCRSLPVDDEPGCVPCSRFARVAALPDPLPLELPGAVANVRGGYTNLVIEGGGVKGAAYAGSLLVLEENGLLEPIDRVAGTSAGAITALLIALGYTPDEVLEIVLGLDFRNFEDGGPIDDVGDLDRLFRDFGLFKGDFALCLFECLVERATGDRESTFADLHRLAGEYESKQTSRHFRELHVFSTNVNRGEPVRFSFETHPDLSLAEAVRNSMSIPYFFSAREYQGDVYVDGGVMMNYPIRAFDGPAGRPNPATIGLHQGTAPGRSEFRGLPAFTRQMFKTLMDTQTDLFCESPEDVRRSIFIDPLGISSIDFDLTREQAWELVKEGARAADAFLRNGPVDHCPVFQTGDPAPG